jgi:hypothetical protein
MKHWVLGFLACGAVTVVACSSDDSSGGGSGGTGTGGTTIGGAGGTGGVITGGSGGGVTGGTGGSSTGGSGGGGDLCQNMFAGANCSQLSTTNPAQTACIHGDCCDEMDACLDDAECGAFLSCSSACGQAGGTPESCGAECQPCITSPTIVQALNNCLLSCLDGGTTTDAGTGGAASDASAD